MVPGSRAKPPAVLIVEDEPLVRLCAVETVEGAGFEVIEAERR
jgi:CheY-like chemotaxis protein